MACNSEFKPTKKIQNKASPDEQNIIISYTYYNGMQFRIARNQLLNNHQYDNFKAIKHYLILLYIILKNSANSHFMDKKYYSRSNNRTIYIKMPTLR